MAEHDESVVEEGGAPLNDCWNRIGVRGDASCPELVQYVHCRNCPVFAAAAGDLLDRELPPGYLAEWTKHFAEPEVVRDPDTHSGVIFRIGQEWLALPTALFEEVAEERAIHSLPHLRNKMVLGLVNVRGELLVCISVARMLGLEAAVAAGAAKADERQAGARRLLVIRYENVRAVFPADEVHGIHRYHPRELKEPPATVTKASPTYTRALLPWRNKSVGLLDEQLLGYALSRSLA